MNIQWLGSPNFTPGRDGHDLITDPRYVVIHATVGTVAGANARFQRGSERASAHYGIGLDGHIVQWVREEDAAWHAGDLEVNLDSIGIVHEDDGDLDGPHTEALYAASAALVRDICGRYGIPLDRQHIRPHSAFSATRCPEALDIARIIAAAAGQQPRTHVVQPGDTMSSIASRFGASLAALEQANPELERGQRWNLIRPGDVVRIP